MYNKAISYSGLSLYRKCPQAWKHAYIDGNRSEPGAAAKRGTRLHQQLEDYFNGKAYPEKSAVLAPWKTFMYDLAAKRPIAEQKLAVDASWQPVGFDDENAHVRGAVDLTYKDGPLVVLDWKSGRIYPEHKGQADIYACMSMDGGPVSVGMVYLDLPLHTQMWDYTAGNVEDLKGALDQEIDVLRLDEEYIATPSDNACYWCPLSWRKGGECTKAP